ncbi:hypothetical protein GCM10025865_03670 [Paraoerskovia sediminicola]|uniref:DUF3017 domain-containing protein n=1 Tax=Paraoerskovia sediminicola TaxID=1138587 RepID=A0ABN6X8D3_9CELL|nr:DUF3017 domain-containing protein [Paraoerskovia sediminicola]BDZ41068.1 hypothetical protein GCM10025865_03670 [Paraoerskovia sediminicola]
MSEPEGHRTARPDDPEVPDAADPEDEVDAVDGAGTMAVGWAPVRAPGGPAAGARPHVPAQGADDPTPSAPRSARAPALWLVLAGVATSTVLTVVVDSAVGIGMLAATLVAAGTARALLGDPGPEGITIRSRGVDIFLYVSAAAALLLLALIAPDV